METLKKRCVEIYEETQWEQRQLFSTCYRKGVSHNHLCLAGTQRQAGERENFRKVRLQAYSEWRWLAGGSWSWAS